jgi:outer membrane protein assembly factor BamA
MTLFKILILIFILISALFSNNYEKKTITSIIVLGNDRTDAEVIKRELLFNIGDKFTDSLRVLSENRVSNLFLFNHVEIIPVPEDHNVTLLVNVTERLFMYPFPKFIIEDRDWDKITYGFGMAHTNLRGQNEKLIGTVLFGYRPGYQLDYFNPWISGTDHVTMGFTIKKYETNHNVLDFLQRNNLIIVTVGKYWTRYFSSSLGFYYSGVKTPQSIAPQMLTGKNEEHLLSFTFSTNYDNRDLIPYPSQGWYLGAGYSKKGFFEKKIDYSFYQFDIRKYITIAEITLAARAAALLTSGDDLPLYDRIYFGFNERIRGHFDEVVAGEQQILGSLEFRFPLVSTFKIDMPSLFLPESSTQNLKFGLNGALFFDSGKVWGRDVHEEFNLEKSEYNGKILSGFGGGLHFRLPYVEVARLEMAFDYKFNSEIIFEIGTAL